MLHAPEVLGVRPGLVVGVAGEPALLHVLVLPCFLDDREEVRDNRVAGGCLAGKGGVSDALVEAVNKFFHSFVWRPVVQ